MPTTPPTWTHHTRANTYTLTVGKIHCRVWLAAVRRWAAIVREYQ